MKTDLSTSVTMDIHAPATEVWEAITTPEVISQYLMGTQVTTDWKEGSPISYKGEYNGKEYHDKGTILKVEPNKLLSSTYWSSMGGKEDKPENYNTVTYRLEDHDSHTAVTLTQDNIGSEEEKEHVTGNWTAVMNKLKEVVELRNENLQS